MTALLLVQLLVIVAACRLCGALARRLGQPEVIGEVAAGILLGPSLLGWLWPGAGAFLFPPDSLAALGLLSQIGLALFMFLIGMELDAGALARRAGSLVLISQTSIILPFALFLGVAMSITAFPVLARVLHERGLSRGPLGALALGCAAVDDATAWCLLAVVAAAARQSSLYAAAGTVALSAAQAAALLWAARPLLRRWAESPGAPGAALLLLLLSALFSELIGLHAIFGAFLAGLALPRDAGLRQVLAARLHGVAAFLLPLFFAVSGLRTELGALRAPGAWAAFAWILAAAVAGKLGGGALAARWSGLPWRESLALGVLLNARGLVELVALNIGLELGVIGPEIFTLMVLMALVTTLMTGPLLSAIQPASLSGVRSSARPAPEGRRSRWA